MHLLHDRYSRRKAIGLLLATSSLIVAGPLTLHVNAAGCPTVTVDGAAENDRIVGTWTTGALLCHVK